MSAVVLKPGEGHTLTLGSIHVVVQEDGTQTRGTFGLAEFEVPPHAPTPPPHIHHAHEEGFYILEGEISFQIGENQIVATAGMFANMPVGTPHSFANKSHKPAKMLISVAPAGLEQMFFDIGVPVDQQATTAPPPSKAEIEKLLKVAPRYGIEIMLPKH